MRIAYGTCVGSWEKFRAYVKPRTRDRELTVLHGQPSITVAYNRILNGYTNDRPDALVLLHEDLEITDLDFEVKIERELVDPNVALVGVAGGRGVGSLAWWNAETYGHQLTDSGMLTLGPPTGDVDSLEGSLLVFSRWAIERLRYDERMTGFHCCDEICIGATRVGKRVVVADIDTHHHTRLGFKSETAQREWFTNDALYRERWGL